MITLFTIFSASLIAVAVCRPHIGFRRTPPADSAACRESTLMLSYDRLRLKSGSGPFQFTRARRNVLFAGYRWTDPAPDVAPDDATSGSPVM